MGMPDRSSGDESYSERVTELFALIGFNGCDDDKGEESYTQSDQENDADGHKDQDA